jgi:hypothetical protein
MVSVEEMSVYPSAPPEFLKKLRRYDSDLQLNWSPKMGCWSIWVRSGPDKIDHVLNVVDENGSSLPLDDTVFAKLARAKFYVNNPGALYQDLVAEPEYRDRKRREKSLQEIEHLGKDRVLRRQFERAREVARRMTLSDFQQTRPLYNKDGTPVMAMSPVTGRMEPVIYKPHSSLK